MALLPRYLQSMPTYQTDVIALCAKCLAIHLQYCHEDSTCEVLTCAFQLLRAIHVGQVSSCCPLAIEQSIEGIAWLMLANK